jgi:hypothetical protein
LNGLKLAGQLNNDLAPSRSAGADAVRKRFSDLESDCMLKFDKPGKLLFSKFVATKKTGSFFLRTEGFE